MEAQKWFEIEGVEKIVTPALLVYPERIEKNIKMMIQIAGGTEFLRPHIKTYKIAEIIEMQLAHGITKFKCATIAESELLAKCGAPDILLAMQPVGGHIDRFFDLIARYPKSKFSTIVDCESVIDEIALLAQTKKIEVSVWLDVNNGMNRTGVLPNDDAVRLYQKIHLNPSLIAKGLHVYDGHVNESNFDSRKELCDLYFDLVLQLKKQIALCGIKVETIVAGGTPTFPIYAKRKNTEVSPGTPLLWDCGYGNKYKDLKFLPAAVLVGNIISKPAPGLMCLNFGHKSVAAEMSFPRLEILNLKNCKQISHSEEHLVVQCFESENYPIGTVCYAIPIHICPTVPKYSEVLVVINNKISDSWKVAARDHKTNF